MRCGLYGKLPSKRDFVALAAPRAFLSVWEPWLQGGISASRAQLGDGWRDAYLRAPIWRFWLGADVCGATVAGAFMPSVDGVGRYFPLTLFASVEKPAAIPPPELDTREPWFAEAERTLLAALDPASDFETVSRNVERLAPPLGQAGPGLPEGMLRLHDGTVATASSPASLPGRLAAIRAADHARAYATTTIWWTIGGEDFPPLALVGQRMPHPDLFGALLTGRFDGGRS